MLTEGMSDAVMSNCTSSSKKFVQDIGDVAREKFESRADRFDREAEFPQEDFSDLHSRGLLASAVPVEFGGMGITPYFGQTLSAWMATRSLASADLSLARCWEGHQNALVLIRAFGTPAQQSDWFSSVVSNGDIWVVWSGEPQSLIPGQQGRYGTTVTPTSGGWLVSGTKIFCTSATGASWAIVMVNLDGPGAARHSAGSSDRLLMLACDLRDPSISVDRSWWDPIGMRATASHLVRFDSTFVPSDRLLGEPGSFFKEHWQAAFTSHYAASFLGAAESAFDQTVRYVHSQKKSADPYVQQRIGSMHLRIEACYLWLKHVADLWDGDMREEAQAAGARARHQIEVFSEQVVGDAVKICGARSLVRPSTLERVLRDLTFYQRHDNIDHILATVGRVVLGESHDRSFHRL